MSDVTSPAIDYERISSELDLSVESIRATLELLDEGNTVPFITRFRRDQTGGLDEPQIWAIQSRVNRERQLLTRKEQILKTVRQKLEDVAEFESAVANADSIKRLEDLYLPFKPKKQNLASIAREQGLGPLADAILSAGMAEAIEEAAASYCCEGAPTPNDVLTGVGYILAEQFSELADLRDKLRELGTASGKLTCSQQERADSAPTNASEEPTAAADPTQSKDDAQQGSSPSTATDQPSAEQSGEADVRSENVENEAAAPSAEPATETTINKPVAVDESPATTDSAGESTEAMEPNQGNGDSPSEGSESFVAEPSADTDSADAAGETQQDPPPSAAANTNEAPKRLSNRKQRLAKKQQKLQAAFADYFGFEEQLSKLPPHRVLAINRGERAKILRAKIDFDSATALESATSHLIEPEHPYEDFLRGCVRDSLQRLIHPSLERECRRELTERAESHAVSVFIRNLRNLLLQPPVIGRRILAIDPGFKSGCKLAALDNFGNLLGHEVIYVVGGEDRQAAGRATLVRMVQEHELSLIAIGNGTACRESENLVASLLGDELKETDCEFVVVNSAGASVYSTSATGREELPDVDPTVRSAVSIGRRVLDPLSELVKINPANIGVGMYQHDVKAKHLRTSLDDVVESCVNYVGVDVNTASPALLRYVSGLNQLTARRLYEYRKENGPFRTRQQLKEVPGFGEATFVQAAGFLRIVDGENPLDATAIHPESYETAMAVLQHCQVEPAELTAPQSPEAMERVATALGQIDQKQLANELGVGRHAFQQILDSLSKSGRDPREGFPGPVFRRGVMKLEDLHTGMELNGTVLNVVDFGAFVDIGLVDSGLVHISRLADQYISDPHSVVSVGDMLQVWVVSVDKERRRVSLTAIPPRPKRSRQRKPQNKKGPPQRRQDRKNKPSRGPKKPKSPKTPAKPITDEMAAGQEPMRSFSDLQQFFDIRKDEKKKP